EGIPGGGGGRGNRRGEALGGGGPRRAAPDGPRGAGGRGGKGAHAGRGGAADDGVREKRDRLRPGGRSGALPPHPPQARRAARDRPVIGNRKSETGNSKDPQPTSDSRFPIPDPR